MEIIGGQADSETAEILDKALTSEVVTVDDGIRLLEIDNRKLYPLLSVADELRCRVIGDRVTFVHNRNINFTNYCQGGCMFCGFSRRLGDQEGFVLNLQQIVDKALEASALGATEVCIQGGLNPEVEPSFYFQVCEAIKNELPDIHIHAFSPMEIFFASRKMGCSTHDFLSDLKSSGLDSMPGTAAEILDDKIRQIICPGKLSVAEWTEVIITAHQQGIPTTATMMYGHIEEPWHIAAHLHLIRSIQQETGGFTEFIPLSFVHSNTNLYRQGLSGPGAPGIMDLKVHAVARLMLNEVINNIQVSWVKLGKRLAQVCLWAGANDLGGTLMEEHITRSAGSLSPTNMTVDELKQMIQDANRIPVQRTTTYEICEVYNG